MSDDWVVGKVRTSSESKVKEKLEEIGVEAYCPMERKKGPRRRTDGTREAIERAAIPGYLPIRAAHVVDAHEALEQEPDFYDFLRDVTNEIATMADEALNPLRQMENAKPVKFISGPVFYLGEVVKVPYESPNVMKAFWGMTGQVVSVKNGRYCIALRDKLSNRTLDTWFNGWQLLASS